MKRPPHPSLLICLLLIAALAVTAVSAQDTLDPEAFFAQADSLIPALMEEHGIPGVSLALIHNNALAGSHVYGIADPETGAPVTEDTPFSAWSIAKIVTAAAIMQQVEAGNFDIDAPISDYLTRWAIPRTRQPLELVTARRIMSHTAGLSAEGCAGFEFDAELPTLEALLDGEGCDRVGVISRPGQRFMYSGGGFTVLQLALEEISGTTYADHMQAAIFEPLGMDDSTFIWSPEINAARDVLPNGEIETRVQHVAQAAGGLYTSSSDLATFIGALNAGEIVSAESAAAIFTAQEATGDEYGFGVYITQLEDGGTLVWHDGIGFGSRSIFVLYPDTGDGLAVLTNSSEGDALFAPLICALDNWSRGTTPEDCH